MMVGCWLVAFEIEGAAVIISLPGYAGITTAQCGNTYELKLFFPLRILREEQEKSRGFPQIGVPLNHPFQ